MVDIELDYEAIGQILKVTCAPAIASLGAQVAANVKSDPNTPDDARVSVRGFVTDRAIAVVMLSHRDAQVLQAKYGILTRAAAANGLEVTAK